MESWNSRNWIHALSGLISSAQEAIGASWAAATAEAPATSTSDSEDYLSANNSSQTACTGSSLKTGDRASASGLSTGTKRTYAKRRRNSSSSTSMSSLEDYQTPRNQPQQSQEQQMTASGSTTPTSLTKATTTPRSANPGRAVMPPPSPNPTGGTSPPVTSTPAILMRSSSPPFPTPTLSLSSALKRKTPLPGQEQSPMRSVFFADSHEQSFIDTGDPWDSLLL